MNDLIREWQRRPATSGDRFVRPADARSYYQDISAERRSPWAAIGLGVGVVVANSALAWAEWAAHEVCVHGNEHSIGAVVVMGGLAAAGFGGSLAGWNSHTAAGSRTAAVLCPTSVMLGGFATLLWSASWPAALAVTFVQSALNALLVVVRAAWVRWWRGLQHEAGMQNDARNADLEKTRMETEAQMGTAAIEYQKDVDVARELRAGDAMRQYDMYERYPETFSPPRVVTSDGRIVTLTPEQLAVPQPLAMAAGAEHLSISPRTPDDDWMDLALTLPGVVKEARR